MSLRLLCDEAVGRDVFFPRLQRRFDAYHVCDQSGLGPGASDRAIRRFATEHELVVFTNDLDFLVVDGRHDHPGVVFYEETATTDEILRALRIVDRLLTSSAIREERLVVRVPGEWG
ncbi:MAG: DUF5615 family PIN-like protein [Haloarculaceae archaeon]